MKKSSVLIVTAVAWLACTAPGYALMLFSNLGQLDDNDGNGMSSINHREASEFLTGSSPSTLTGLTARVDNGDTISHGFNAYLYGDSGSGTPGSLLATFIPVDNTIPASTASKLITFSHAGISLAANTQYWIALSSTENASSGSFTWRDTASDNEDVGSLFTNGTPPLRALSTNGVPTWEFTRGGNSFFALEGALIPEPASWLLASFAAILCLRSARSRRKR